MAAETLNFGPEWLRALSSGGSVTSPPSSPAMPKYKLADYRYGREEMLALYIKENKVPEEMQDKEFAAIVQEEPLQPLALVPLTEEEQRNFSMSVNSVAVLRLMGKSGGPPPAGVSRGRGGTRGRGRGRGEGGYYQRSIEDGDGGFGRGSREIHRSQSWDDRGERRFEKPVRRDMGRGGFDEGSTASSRKEYARSDSDNWRTLREEHDEDDEGSWRVAGSRRENERWRSTSPEGARSAGWRDHNDRRRKFDFDFRERDEERGPRRNRSNSDNFEDEKDLLPEWCMDDEEEEMGTFDSSGAFLSLKKSPKEPIPEEQELDFKGVLEEEEESEMKDDIKQYVEPSNAEKAGSYDELCSADGKDALLHKMTEDNKLLEPRSCSPSSTSRNPANNTATVSSVESENLPQSAVESEIVTSASGRQGHTSAVEDDSESLVPAAQIGSGASNAHCSSPSTTSAAGGSGVAVTASVATEFPSGDIEDDDGMTHLQQEAEKMVASLQDNSLDEDQFSQAVQEQRNTAAALPLSHEAAMKWFYKDPQGEIQGPFSTQEMAEWFQAGYFSMALLVKRGCDEGFQPLGDVIKMWGRVPFAPGPSPPPLLGNMDQERLKKQQEMATAALYQQFHQQQVLHLLSRQPYAHCTLQQKAATGDVTPQQISTFMQQLLKSRCGEQGAIPSMNRSMSVPDTASLWDMHTSASQPTGSEANCLWDLPINSSTQGPVLEQLQLQHKISTCPSWGQQPLSGSANQNSFKACIPKVGEGRGREPRDECRQQQELLLKFLQSQQAQPNSSAIWNSLSKQNSSIKSLLELQQEGERQLQKPRGPSRAHPAVGMSSASMTSLPTQWGAESSSMWGNHDKNSAAGLWEDSLKNGPVMRSIGLKNSRSSPSLSDAYGITSRQNRKKTEEEEKLLKLLQGIKQQDGFTQWCEQMLHALNTSNNFDVPTFVSFLKDVDSPYDVHDYIRSYLGDTREAKEFAKQFLERRAKQKVNQQRQQQQLSKELNLNLNFSIQPERLQDTPWVNHSSLQSVFQVNHTSKQQSYDSSGQAGKLKKNTVLHADPSILGQRTSGSQLFDSFAPNKLGAPVGYSLHSSPGEMETIEDY